MSKAESVSMNVHAVILAAGESTRMRSEQPKVLHQLAGRPLIEYSVLLAEALTEQAPWVVVGRHAERVIALLGERAQYVEQRERLGTGHALLQTRPFLAEQPGAVLVFYGDMPLLTLESMQQLLALHAASGAVLSMLTFEGSQPRGFGRIQRNPTGDVLAIIEETDCTPEQLALRELNAGLYCFDSAWLWPNLDCIPRSAKGEYYLTDLVGIAVTQGQRVAAHRVADETEMLGINTRVHLAEAEAALRRRINRQWMEAGVTLIDPQTTYIDDTVVLGTDTVIHPGTHLRGNTRIGRACVIGPNCFVRDAEIGDGCTARYSVIEHARLEDHVDVGPFAHLRQGAHLAQGVHMGNFGEVKNSYLGPGTKMGHFSYMGDAILGHNVNIGAGTVTCNYDGSHKHQTIVGDDVFIGSDTMLVAPIVLGPGARTGAGSVVTHDVPPGALVVGVPARTRSTEP
jgi:bifunctional UDP-N-acetylglucosamine pyrophosphorylase/glucosamine-1-phosphate N-acetyltransferase